ncbi:MAG: radical SAM family heme chaperone HemW [Actinomycetota bacterium]
MYVHVPFCAHRCDYCDFATWTDRAHLIDAYVGACVTDLRRRAGDGCPPATTVFFGGGTPSLLPAPSLVGILDAITRTDDAEVTVECNPDSVDAPKLAAYRAAGVNRLSLGVQSLDSAVLTGLGRTHDPENVTRAVELARGQGFHNISVDLIYGTPGESTESWRASVTGVLSLGVEHVSAYALTIEAGTPLGVRVAGGAPAPDDDDQADKYVIADELLEAAGLSWYEVSNWARAGRECRHNLGYWRQHDYLAIGCAAHGHRAGRRWWNVRTPDRYIAGIEAGESPEAGAELLAPAARAEERVVLALRTRDGVPVQTRAPVDALIAELVAEDLVTRTGDRIVLTRRGRLLASDVTARLLCTGAIGTR